MDLWVDDGLEVCCCVIPGPEAEEFKARAGLGMVYYVESLGCVVIFDSQWVEICLGGGEVQELEGLRLGVGGGVVVEVEFSLMLGVFEDTLLRCLV